MLKRKTSIGDLMRQSADDGKQEEFFETKNEDGEVLVLDEEQASEGKHEGDVEPLDTEPVITEDTEEGGEDTEGENKDSVEEADLEEESSGEGEENSDDEKEEEGSDVEKAEEETVEVLQETEMALQSFQNILKDMEQVGGVALYHRSQLLHIDGEMTLQSAHHYSSLPTTLCLQSTKENIIVSMIKKMAFAFGRVVQFMMMSILFCMGLSESNRAKFMALHPAKAVIAFPVYIPKALGDLKNRIFGGRKKKELEEKAILKKQEGQVEKCVKITNVDMSANSTGTGKLNAAEVFRKKMEEAKQKGMENYKISEDSIPDVDTSSIPEFSINPFGQLTQANKIAQGVSIKGLSLTRDQKASVIDNWLSKKNDKYIASFSSDDVIKTVIEHGTKENNKKVLGLTLVQQALQDGSIKSVLSVKKSDLVQDMNPEEAIIKQCRVNVDWVDEMLKRYKNTDGANLEEFKKEFLNTAKQQYETLEVMKTKRLNSGNSGVVKYSSNKNLNSLINMIENSRGEAEKRAGITTDVFNGKTIKTMFQARFDMNRHAPVVYHNTTLTSLTPDIASMSKQINEWFLKEMEHIGLFIDMGSASHFSDMDDKIESIDLRHVQTDISSKINSHLNYMLKEAQTSLGHMERTVRNLRTINHVMERAEETLDWTIELIWKHPEFQKCLN